MTTAAILEAENVRMTLGRDAAIAEALKGVSVSLAIGQLTLLMGPSGSGKSTLLSILGGILRQTEGLVRIAGTLTDGLDSEQLAEVRRRHIGFVFQSFNLFPGLTALENVKASLAIRSRVSSDAQHKASRALETVGLGQKLHALPGQLSGGEQQRVAVARAIVAGPKIILADEPTASLDAKAGRVVMQHLQGIAHEQACAVLIVSHDPRAVPFADRVLMMEDGRVVHDGRHVAAAANAVKGCTHV